jgi:hypothetical protein
MTMHAHALAPYQAAQIARRGEKLLQRRQLTTHQYALLQIMLWRVRKPGSATLIAAMGVLAQLAGQARSTVIDGLNRLEELGLIVRIQRRARVAWMGSVASRVIANAYRMVAPDTETGRPAAREEPLRSITVFEAPIAAVRNAQERLETIARERLRAIVLGKEGLGKW